MNIVENDYENDKVYVNLQHVKVVSQHGLEVTLYGGTPGKRSTLGIDLNNFVEKYKINENPDFVQFTDYENGKPLFLSKHGIFAVHELGEHKVTNVVYAGYGGVYVSEPYDEVVQKLGLIKGDQDQC
ncbi:hypothetical protein RFF38_02555 [Pasteurella multocida]|uniref:hypothetical protein n=1 Tax=Pasteurella multocida TaxID=747 RepID=UPI002B48A789|nr:hypothetical protein [Pasteurella multocida]WRK07730.1 hypothetical protein RFF38_02555 [Pasteurella multocida]